MSSKSLGSIALLSCAVFAATGCGVTKNLEDMHDSTAKMTETTRQMNEKMDQMTAMNKQMTSMNTQMTTMSDQMGKMLESMDKMAQGMSAMQTTMTGMATFMSQMTEMNAAMKEMLKTLSTMSQQMSVMPQMAESLTQMGKTLGKLNEMMADMDKKMGALPEMKAALNGLRSDLKVLGGMFGVLSKMQKSMGDLGDQMNHVDKLATKGVVDGMHGAAEALRRDELAAMKATQNLAGKFTHAAAFFAAYDYQFVLAKTQELAQADEETFRRDAVTDFFFQANSLTDSSKSIDMAIQSGRMMDLYALAAAADYLDTNTRQHLIALKRDPNQFLTMYGMIEEALGRKAKIQGGDKATEWENQVLINEQEAVYLLQLRENILAGVVLQNISNLPQNPHGILDRIDELAHAGYYMTMDWSGNVAKLNNSQLADYGTTMAKANEARDFLQAHGYDPRINSSVHDALKHFKIKIEGSDARRNGLLKRLQDQIAHYAR